jgi:aspartyl protease family protein
MGAGNFLYGGIGLAAIAIAATYLQKVEAPNLPATPHSASEPGAAPSPVSNGFGSVAVERSADSHFYAYALVNGARVRFLIDTGSSSVVLTRADALRAGIGAGDYDARAIGAGGEIRLMPATLTRLTLGPLAADAVPAMVAEQTLPVSLLGQTFLSRIDSVTIEGDRMVLR